MIMNHNWLKTAKKWVIPSHLEESKKAESAIVRYWTVTITLTSGEVEQVYVKARNKFEALEKANEITYLASIKLKKNGFRLIP